MPARPSTRVGLAGVVDEDDLTRDGMLDLTAEPWLRWRLISLSTVAARSGHAHRRTFTDTELTDDDWWRRIESGLNESVGRPTPSPTAARVGQAVGEATNSATDSRGAFQLGIRVRLDGAEALIVSTSTEQLPGGQPP